MREISVGNEQATENCATICGYRFHDRRLFEEALTHRSYVNEGPEGVRDNERLEFLGDAVLGFIVATVLVKRFPLQREGELSRIRASLVGEKPLAGVASGLGLGEMMVLGKGEAASGGRERPSMLAGVYEAVVAALFLDGGIEAAERFVETSLLPLLETPGDDRGLDAKTELQEFLQRSFGTPPRYSVTSVSGPDHRPQFTVAVAVAGEVIASGEGRSRKGAEQEAARKALELLREKR